MPETVPFPARNFPEPSTTRRGTVTAGRPILLLNPAIRRVRIAQPRLSAEAYPAQCRQATMPCLGPVSTSATPRSTPRNASGRRAPRGGAADGATGGKRPRFPGNVAVFHSAQQAAPTGAARPCLPASMAVGPRRAGGECCCAGAEPDGGPPKFPSPSRRRRRALVARGELHPLETRRMVIAKNFRVAEQILCTTASAYFSRPRAGDFFLWLRRGRPARRPRPARCGRGASQVPARAAIVLAARPMASTTARPITSASPWCTRGKPPARAEGPASPRVALRERGGHGHHGRHLAALPRQDDESCP